MPSATPAALADVLAGADAGAPELGSVGVLAEGAEVAAGAEVRGTGVGPGERAG